MTILALVEWTFSVEKTQKTTNKLITEQNVLKDAVLFLLTV